MSAVRCSQVVAPADPATRYASRLTLDEAFSLAKGVTATTLGDLLRTDIPSRVTLLARGKTPIIREGQLGQVYATRGVGKTWFNLTLALVMASGGSAMLYRSPMPSRVLYIDGEMAYEDLKSRCEQLKRLLNLDGSVDNNLVLIAADRQDEPLPLLDTAEGQTLVEPFVEWADVVILDNRSCLFDSEGEKDAKAWEPAGAWIASLRRRKKACLMVHHANRQGGARGHGKAEDPLDIVINLKVPDNYSATQGARFMVEFTKSRGIAGGNAVLPFTTALTDEGWVVEDTDGRSSTAATIETRILNTVASGNYRTKTATLSKVTGKTRDKVTVWDELIADGYLTQSPDGVWALTDKGQHARQTAA